MPAQKKLVQFLGHKSGQLSRSLVKWVYNYEPYKGKQRYWEVPYQTWCQELCECESLTRRTLGRLLLKDPVGGV